MRVWFRFRRWGVSMPWWMALLFYLFWLAGALIVLTFWLPFYGTVKLLEWADSKRQTAGEG